MSNFSLSVDLLRFVGAEVCSLDFKGQKRNCIIIPVNWNDIEVKVDNNGKPSGAVLATLQIKRNFSERACPRNPGRLCASGRT